MLICLPIAGRLTGIYGTKRVAAVGALGFPISLVAISMMNGDIRVYLVIHVARTIVCSTATSTVYSRVVAAAFSARRGLALAICGSSPPIIGALASPLVTGFVEDHGWRAGYLLVAGFCTVCAALTLLLLPGHTSARNKSPASQADRPTGAYRTIAASPTFWILLIGTLLVNLPFALAHAQIKLLAIDNGLSDATAALVVSAFAIASIVGRLVSGIAIDYLPAHRVAAFGFFLPCCGLVLLAMGVDSTLAVTTGVALIGLAFGAEADVIPNLVRYHFPLPVCSTVLGMLSAAMGCALGNVLIAIVLQATERFDPFLMGAALTSFIASGLFLLLGRSVARHREAVEAIA
jgi:MFS family permease